MFNLKKIIPLSLAAALLISTTVVYAEGTTTPANNRSAYSQEIKDTRDTILTNREANRTIRESINQKWTELKDTVKSLKGTGQLKAKKADIEAKRQEIQAERTELKSSNEALKNKWDQIKQDKTNKDYGKLSSDLKEVPSMQQTKKGILQRISDSVSSFLGFLKA